MYKTINGGGARANQFSVAIILVDEIDTRRFSPLEHFTFSMSISADSGTNYWVKLQFLIEVARYMFLVIELMMRGLLQIYNDAEYEYLEMMLELMA